ncbi:Permease of the drug/metabolite transporter (DMT) superfamily [Paracoccus aminovorans]|uniref:Permease of the drug/metabolite transporter (DMT) superfamily n=2 Tax=Paracoccus aminovorans TaxID=34004 RepID=A0A1I2ZMV5_9RHOB|nr:ABC transporter permease [Paracoccus aminovorans]SFH39163.1 Permease of the drug/metabolite transporter (DMT) superfamily [Paracoccus aminovorans]
MSSPSPSRRPMTPMEWAMLLALATVWGGSFFFNAVAVRELPVLTVVVSRVVLAAILLLAIMRLRGERLPPDRRVWVAFFGMGLLNNAIPFSLIVWGQQHIASGVASILNATTPLFTVVLAHVLTRDERLTRGKFAGVLAGLAGVAAMIGPDALQELDAGSVAQLLCLGAAMSYAAAGIFGRRFRAMKISPMSTATGQVIASSLTMLPLVLILDRPWTLPPPSPAAIGALIGVAAISTALAYALYFRILATAGATNLLLVTFLIPVSAILLGTFFLGETLLARHVAGMALIGAGAAAIDGRLWQAATAQRKGTVE